MTDFKFWTKTALYRLAPGGYGYYRHLKQFRDYNYLHSRDKHPVRNKHYRGEEGWRKQSEEASLRYRDYANYEEYLTHQKQKLDEILKLNGGFSNQSIASYRRTFYRRFKVLPQYLPESAYIICAGARQGTEVEVLQDLGFKNAYGIDLNPGPDNQWVRPGDFMKLENADNSVDMIYSNCLDHAFDLDAMFKEHARVLKPDGYVLYDITTVGGGAFEAVEWNSAEAILQAVLHHFKTLLEANREEAWLWVLLSGKHSLQAKADS